MSTLAFKIPVRLFLYLEIFEIFIYLKHITHFKVLFRHPKILGANLVIAYTLFAFKKIVGIRGFGFYEN